LWYPRCSNTMGMWMWLTRVRRTRSASQRNRSHGLVSGYTEAMERSPACAVNDGARDRSLIALCCIPCQYSPVCVNQPAVLTASDCYNTVTSTNTCMNALVTKVEGNVGGVCWSGKRNCLTKMWRGSICATYFYALSVALQGLTWTWLRSSSSLDTWTTNRMTIKPNSLLSILESVGWNT
jgi:hypothetical protein